MIDQHKTLSEKFLKKGFWLYLFSFIIAPIGYIIKIIVSDNLTQSDVGILYVVISFITMVSAFNDFGMSESIKYFLPKFIEEKRRDKVKTIVIYAFLMQMITGIILASLFYFWSDFLAQNYFKNPKAENILKIFSLYFIGINFFQVLSAFFMAVQNTFANKISEFMRMMFILFSVIWMYFLNLGTLENYSYSWIIGLYIGILFIVGLFYRKYYTTYLKNEKILWDKILFKKIFVYAVVVCLWAQVGTLLSQIDMQMVAYFLDMEQAGYYTNYVSIISIPFMLIWPIFAFLFPVTSELYGRWKIEKIKNLKNFFIKIFIAIGLMFSIFFFVFSEQITLFLFKEKFLVSGMILKYSVLFLVFNFLLQINFNIMAGIGKVTQRLIILLIAIVFNSVLNFVFIHWIWVAGVALATAFGWVLIFILSEIFLGKEYKILLDFKNLFKNIILLGIWGFLFHYFWISFFKNLERFESFGLLFLFSVIWFWFFVGINYSMFKSFILEVKKLKWKKN